MGRRTAVVERNRRNLRPFLSRSGAMARCNRKSAAFESNGSRNDIFHAAELFLFRRRFRRFVDRLDLVQHSARCPQTKESSWAANVQRGSGSVENGARAIAKFSAVARSS